MKIALIGTGAMGCIFGAALARSGAELVCLDRNPAVVAALQEQGIRLRGVLGEQVVAVRATTDPAQLGQVDMALVLVDAAATAAAAEVARACLGEDGFALSLQNGIGNAHILRAALPSHRVCAGMVPFNVVQLPPSRLHRGTWGELMVQADAGWAPWHAAFAAARLPLQERADMREVQWGKLLLNLNNAINALSGVPLKAQLAQRGYRRILATLIDEALAALRAAGIAPAQIGKLPPHRMPFVLRLPDWLFTRIAAGMLKIDPEARSSMWEDLQAGRRTEVDEFNGAVAALAQAHGLQAPCNRAITALVHQAEQGGRRDWSADELQRALMSVR